MFARSRAVCTSSAMYFAACFEVGDGLRDAS